MQIAFTAVGIALVSLIVGAEDKPAPQVDELVNKAAASAAAGEFKPAAEFYTQAAKLHPDSAELWFLCGSARFKSGDINGSITAWDRQIALQPASKKSHWQRGISYYYAGQYRKGQRQFELYQTYDDNDVENVVWRFLCQARVDGIEKARGDMLPVRLDRRVPMMTINDLFRGKVSIEDVMAAAGKGSPGKSELSHRLFYAHLYASLYCEVTRQPDKAKHHIREAEKRKISHYMWDVASVHAKRFGPSTE